MKQVYKNYIFSNFKNGISDKQITKNELISYESCNVDIDGFLIKAAKNFDNYFINKFNNYDDYIVFFNKNKDILQKIISVVDYEFYDENDNSMHIRYLCFDNDNCLYEMDFKNFIISKINFVFDEFPLIAKDEKYLYLYNNLGGLVFFNNYQPQYFDNLLQVKDFIVFDDVKLFIDTTHFYSVFYYENTFLVNLTSDIENYNRLDFDIRNGKILKIAKIKNNIYIFQEYKISSINIMSTKNKISDICFLNFKIIENTICETNDSFVFLTTNGVKLFDGNDIKDIFSVLKKRINYNDNNICACMYDDVYYLKTSYQFDDSLKSVLIACFVDQGKIIFYKFDSDILSIKLIQNLSDYSFIVITNNLNDRVLNLNLNKNSEEFKSVKFNKIYFDSSDLKQINLIKFISSGAFNLKINTDIEEKEISVYDWQKVFNVMMKGHIFQFEITSDNDFEIESIFVEVMTVEDRL